MVSSPTLASTCFACSGVSDVGWAWPESAPSFAPLSQDLHPPTLNAATRKRSDDRAFTAAKPTTALGPLHASRPAAKHGACETSAQAARAPTPDLASIRLPRLRGIRSFVTG